MTDRDVHLPVAAQPTIDSIVDYAQTAENGGHNCAWLPETWGRDGVTVLTAMAERTDSIDVGSSILNTYSRTPAMLGQTAATLQEVSRGPIPAGTRSERPRRDRELARCGVRESPQANPARRSRSSVRCSPGRPSITTATTSISRAFGSAVTRRRRRRRSRSPAWDPRRSNSRAASPTAGTASCSPRGNERPTRGHRARC